MNHRENKFFPQKKKNTPLKKMVCMCYKQPQHWKDWKDRKTPFASETTLNQDKFPAEIAFELTPLHFTEKASLYKHS